MVLITFCTTDKKIYKINIPPEKTIEEAKEIYINQTGSNNSDKIKMLYNKKILQDQDTIDSLNIKEDDLIVVLSASKMKQNQIIKNEDQLPEVQPLPHYNSISPNDDFILFNKANKRRIIRKKSSSIQKMKLFPTKIQKVYQSNRVCQNKNSPQRRGNVVMIYVIVSNPNLPKGQQSNSQVLSNLPMPFLRGIEQTIRSFASQNARHPVINSVSQQPLSPNMQNIARIRNLANLKQLNRHRPSERFISMASAIRNSRVRRLNRTKVFNEIRFFYLVQLHCFIFIVLANLMRMNKRN